MANHKSAQKRIRQTDRRRRRNQHQKSRMRSVVKGFTAAEGPEALRNAERAIRKAASKGIIPKRRASRAVGRLAKRLNAATPSS